MTFLFVFGKWLNKKAKFNFRPYDIIYWEVNNCDTHNNEILSVDIT